MSGPAELAMATGVLLDASIKATVLIGAAFGLHLGLQRATAATRHAMWTAALIGVALLPVIGWSRGAEIAIDRPWIAAVWAVGAAVAFTRFAVGLADLVRISRGLDTHRIGRARIATTAAVKSPITWGVIRPLVLMPPTGTWTAQQRNAAMAHELAHVSRFDWLVHVLVWLVCSAFWFHPLVWLARRQLVREAECAADDAVLAKGMRPSAYADMLLFAGTGRHRAVALGVGSSELGRRITAVLQPHRPRHGRRWPVFLACGAIAWIALPGLGTWPTWTANAESLVCSPAPVVGDLP